MNGLPSMDMLALEVRDGKIRATCLICMVDIADDIHYLNQAYVAWRYHQAEKTQKAKRAEMKPLIRVHSTPRGFSVSRNGIWVPGIFETNQTAWNAVAVADAHPEAYAEMQVRVNHVDHEDRNIRQSDLDGVG